MPTSAVPLHPMPYIETVPEHEAHGATQVMYRQARNHYGYLPNMTAIFGHRPEVMQGWSALLTAVRGNLSPRRYELVTLAAARALRSSYCMLAHGSVLLTQGLDAAQVAAIARDAPEAELTAQERLIMDYAECVARDATEVDAERIAALRQSGLSDTEIFDIAATAAMRCFFSKLLDALGAPPDPAYGALEADLRNALTPGRPIG